MKVRELIHALEELEEKHSDCNVRVDSLDYYLDIHRIAELTYENDTITINIK